MRHHRHRPPAQRPSRAAVGRAPRPARAVPPALLADALDGRLDARRSTPSPTASSDVDRAAAGRRPASRRCSPTAALAAARRRAARRRVDAAIADLEAELDAGRRAERRRARGRQRRARPPEGRGVGGRSATGCAPPGRSPTWPAPTPAAAAIEAYTSIQQALSALDRLEVRGRDSAGLHVLVRGHGLDLDRAGDRPRCSPTAPATRCSRRRRCARPRATSASSTRRRPRSASSATTPAALRAAIRDDALLRQALAGRRRRGARARPHPLGERRHHLPAQRPPAQLRRGRPRPTGPYVTAALNGDVDNFADLKAADGAAHRRRDHHRRQGHPHARVAPARRRATSRSRRSAQTVDQLRGLGRHRRQRRPPTPDRPAARPAGQRPGALRRPRRGPATSWPASPTAWSRRPTATCAWTARRRPTPTTRPPAAARSSSSTAPRAGTLDGHPPRWPTTARELPVARRRAGHAPQITTRDIDRGDYPHFLLKEITEAPASFRKTLRGKLVERRRRAARRARRRRRCPADAARRPARRRHHAGPGHRPGHRRGRRPEPGRGARARRSPATALRVEALLGHRAVRLRAARRHERHAGRRHQPVGHHHRHQPHGRPGARPRGATVVAIVNRRSSDLTDKSDGVLYTSDGRDVEMSVASTKAFYAQIAAGFLLALRHRRRGRRRDRRRPSASSCSPALRELPDAHGGARSSRRPTHRRGRPAARAEPALLGDRRQRRRTASPPQEVRIKLSELCYKSIACDATEDKKHIDLSSEPLILVCAAGLDGLDRRRRGQGGGDLPGPQGGADRHRHRGRGALRRRAAGASPCPPTHPQLAFVLSTMVGHLFGYEAALAIDAQARPLREARGRHRGRASSSRGRRRRRPAARRPAARARAARRPASSTACAAAPTTATSRPAPRCGWRRCSATPLGIAPLEAYQVEYGRVGTPSVVIEDLTAALTAAIEELTRPVDAIKHQAKTVTVGISRSDESLLRSPLVAGGARRRRRPRPAQLQGAAHAGRPRPGGRRGRRLHPLPHRGRRRATARPRSRSSTGAASPATCRCAPSENPLLRGTKHRVATEREVTVAVGPQRRPHARASCPRSRATRAPASRCCTCRFADRPAAADACARCSRATAAATPRCKDAVTETEPTFRDDLLGELPLVELLTAPVNVLADRWRSTDDADRDRSCC